MVEKRLLKNIRKTVLIIILTVIAIITPKVLRIFSNFRKPVVVAFDSNRDGKDDLYYYFPPGTRIDSKITDYTFKRNLSAEVYDSAMPAGMTHSHRIFKNGLIYKNGRPYSGEIIDYMDFVGADTTGFVIEFKDGKVNHLSNFGAKETTEYSIDDNQIVLAVTDRNGDGKYDMKEYYDHGIPIRQEVDINLDGKPDVWCYYYDTPMTRNNIFGVQMFFPPWKRVEKDTNFDGVVDVKTYFDIDTRGYSVVRKK